MYIKIVKPIFDFLFALTILFCVSPVLILITILLFLVNKGNPFFVQKRPGKNGAIFSIVKFKTMNEAKNKIGELLPDSDRLTKVGKFIRKTSLDELPQFLNVLKGDMSVIGPRPLLPEYLMIYSDEQKKRHNVKPGITGLTQVSGRNKVDWNEKFKLDVWYVENLSFKLDVKIFFKTFLKVFKSEGISKEGQATTTKFLGNG